MYHWYSGYVLGERSRGPSLTSVTRAKSTGPDSQAASYRGASAKIVNDIMLKRCQTVNMMLCLFHFYLYL